MKNCPICSVELFSTEDLLFKLLNRKQYYENELFKILDNESFLKNIFQTRISEIKIIISDIAKIFQNQCQSQDGI